MANPLAHEKELYEQIKREKITVPLRIWDLMYHYMGDDISAISQIVFTYLKVNQSIPIDDAKKIKEHTLRINETVNKIIRPDKMSGEEKIADLKKNEQMLHPIVNELFCHYIGNDVYGINLIVGFHIDPTDENPIPIEYAQKILDRINTMKQFMDRLREATHQDLESTENLA